MINATGGMAEPSMQVEDKDDGKRRIKQNHFSSSVKVEYHGNLSANGDPYLATQAKKYGLINQVSEDNRQLYENRKEEIKRFKS